MGNFLKRVLTPPVFPGDEEKTRVGRIQHILLCFLLVDILVASVLLLAFLPEPTPTLWFNLPLFFLVIVLMGAVRRGWVQSAAYAILAAGTIYIAAALLTNGGVHSPVTAAFFVLVLIAGAMLGRRGMVQMLAAAVLIVLAILVLELSGNLPPAFIPITPVQVGIVYISTLAAVAVLAYLYVHGLEHALQRARAGEARSKEQVRWLSSLRAIDVAITNNEDLRLTLSILLDQLFNGLGPDAAEVLRLDGGSGLLHRLDGRGFRSAVARDVPQSSQHGCAGKAIRSMMADGCAETDPKDIPQPYQEEGFISWYAAPLVVKGITRGLVQVFFRRRFAASEEWLNQFETLSGQAAIAIDNAELLGSLRQANEDLEQAYQITLEGWIDMLDRRDHETKQHTRRVSELSVRLGRLIGISQDELDHLYRGAWLHDIGKIGISDAIFKKKGPLSPEELAEIRKHPVYAYDNLSRIDFLAPALDIPYCHHERWDGLGYPRGLKGTEIPLPARIFSVADVYDALTTERDYRRPKAWPPQKALDYIREMAGKQFDPHVVGVFLSHPEILENL